MRHLVDPLGAGEVGQSVLSEVDEPHAGGKVVPAGPRGDVRTDDLTAGGGGEQAGGAVERRTEPVPGATFRRPGVNRHAHPQRGGRRPRHLEQSALDRHRGLHGGGHGWERDAEPVAGVAEGLAAVGLRGFENQCVMAGEVGRHCLLISFPSAGAGLYVSEEEDDDVGGPAVRRRCHRRADRCGEVGGLAEDPFLEPTEFRRRLHAELLSQDVAHLLVGPQGVGLAAQPVERQHHLAPRPFPQRVLSHVGLQPGQGILGPAEGQQRLGEVFDGTQAGLLQPLRLQPGKWPVGKVPQRGTPPQRQRRFEPLSRRGGVAAGERLPPFGCQPVEPEGVHAVERRLEDVAAVPGPEAGRLAAAGRSGRFERPPQPGYEAL